jgi:hypothetical protein
LISDIRSIRVIRAKQFTASRFGGTATAEQDHTDFTDRTDQAGRTKPTRLISAIRSIRVIRVIRAKQFRASRPGEDQNS